MNQSPSAEPVELKTGDQIEVMNVASFCPALLGLSPPSDSDNLIILQIHLEGRSRYFCFTGAESNAAEVSADLPIKLKLFSLE